jgi:AbrB family looped-hinge helix DNA binding protein
VTHPAIATLTSKGQLTVPKAIREALGLREGDQVRFELDASLGKVEFAPVKNRVQDLWNLAVPGARKMSLREMERAIAEGAGR